MAFKASKTRQRRAPLPVAEGTQLIASAAVREWYYKAIRDIAGEMLRDYRKEIEKATQRGELKRFYAKDASPSSQFNELLSALNHKWIRIFKEYAKFTAEEFVNKVDKHSKTTCWHSLSTAGVDQPRLTYNENVRHTLNAAVDFNQTLVTRIQQEVHEKIYTAVMTSLTSPNPEEQGTRGIFNALTEAGEFSTKRAKLIARDQNSKLYSSLNIDRMRDNGVDKFRWIHSSAGKVPRPSHVAKDGEIFELDDPRLWEGPKADRGPPGWAINCRCRAVPII